MEHTEHNEGGADNGATLRAQGTPRQKSLRWSRLSLWRTGTSTLAIAAVLFCTGTAAFASDVIYQYHPNVFSGYSWGYSATDGSSWQDAFFNFFPAQATTVDQFCFDMTFTYADQQSGSTTFTMTPYFFYGSSILTKIMLWQQAAQWGLSWPLISTYLIPYGSWQPLLTGATTSFQTTWTRSTSGSGTTADPVCFDVLGALHHTMGLPTGYPVSFKISMATADRMDCRRDLGNNSRCYVYYNTALASQSIGFSFMGGDGSTKYDRNALMAGDLIGFTLSPLYLNGGAVFPQIPTASSSYSWCEGDAFCSQFSGIMSWAFQPDIRNIPDFAQLASALSMKPPWGYWTLVKQNMTGIATSSSTTMDAAYTATQPLVDPLKTGMAVIVYLWGAYYLYRRLTHFEL